MVVHVHVHVECRHKMASMAYTQRMLRIAQLRKSQHVASKNWDKIVQEDKFLDFGIPCLAVTGHRVVLTLGVWDKQEWRA